MYYQSRTNHFENISSLTNEEQVEHIKNMGIGKGYIINNTLWLNNANPSGCGVGEAAVFFIDNLKYFEFESVTIPWCSDISIEAMISKFQNKEYLEATYNLSKKNAVVLNDRNALVWFTCSCCGSGFKSSIKEQSIHDLDSGFGLCKSC